MKRTSLTVVAITALTIAACAKAEEGDGTVADTMTVPGTETVDVPTQVPTTDTIVKTTDVDVDTIEGEPRDTTRRR